MMTHPVEYVGGVLDGHRFDITALIGSIRCRETGDVYVRIDNATRTPARFLLESIDPRHLSDPPTDPPQKG